MNSSGFLTQFGTSSVFLNNSNDDNTIERVEKVDHLKVGHLWLEKVNKDRRKCDMSLLILARKEF